MSNTKNQEVFAQVTDRMITRMEAGVDPWKAGYTPFLPMSVSSGKPYSGANYFNLSFAAADSGYKSNQWLTFPEAIKRGGHVKRGEKGTRVVRWREWTKKTEDGPEVSDGEGKKEPKARLLPFTSTVFNYDQTEGVTLDVDPYPKLAEIKPEEVHLRAQQFVENADICRIVEGGNQPCYSMSADTIQIPQRQQWTGGLDRFYNTLFHEMVHATGHPDRLARFDTTNFGKQGSTEYAFEEMVALFGQNYLSAQAGLDISQLEPVNAAYLQHWAGECRKDPSRMYKAQKAGFAGASFIIDRAKAKETPVVIAAMSPEERTAALLREIEQLPPDLEPALAHAS
jgi:antirestriction protein ArdC